MDFAKASYNSIHGEIKAEWKKLDANTYEYSGSILTNCAAEVVLPNKTVIMKSRMFRYFRKVKLSVF